MRRLLLVTAGGLGALLTRRVYLASVAFPNAVQQAGQRMQDDIAAVRQFHDEMDGLGLSQKERLAAADGFMRGRFGRGLSSAAPTR